tara:strand:+ start:339 stop:656 length:318 start_codon:yes stop_codon:yes gene_type:complete
LFYSVNPSGNITYAVIELLFSRLVIKLNGRQGYQFLHNRIHKMKIDITREDRLSIKDISDRYSVASATVRRWMRDEGLPFVYVGNKRYTNVEEFNKWCANREPKR